MIVLKIVFAGLSVFVLGATAWVIGAVASRSGSLAFLGEPDTRRLRNLWRIAVGAGAFLGAAVCIYAGVERLLWWVPHSWGGYDDNGEWTWLGESVAGVCSLAGAFACAGVVSAKVEALIAERHRAELAEWERRRNAAD